MATPGTGDMRPPAPAPNHERGVHLVTPDTPTDTNGIVCTAVTPRLTDWLPELLASLREATVEAVQTQTPQTDSWRVSSTILSETIPEWNTLDTEWDDATAEAVAYTRAITTLAVEYDADEGNLSAYHDQRKASLLDTTESIGTGRGPVNATLGALAKGPVALHRELDDAPQRVTLILDGASWTDLADRRTGVRALAAIAVLADGFDVRVVVSPALQRELTRRYPQWSEVHLGLTGRWDRSQQGGHHTRTEPVTDEAHPAWTALDRLATTPGKRRLLANLDTEHPRSYRDLEQDHVIDIEAGTVSRYVLDLEKRDLVIVDRRGHHNTVRLSALGTTAVTEFLDADANLVRPNQHRLSDCLTDTPHDCTSTVSPRREAQRGDPTTPTDAWVAATGDPDSDADYVQWLTGPAGTRDKQSIHRRFAAAARETGITLVDDQLEPFDDGRVTYLSHHNETALVICQWGGPLATLGRLAAALLSEKALSKILTPSRVGHDFTAIHDGSDHNPGRTLRRGHQVGWFSEADTTYNAWRERIERVRDEHLAKLAELTSSTDTAARSELFEDLHGLVASASQLYHAAGIDLTTTLRLPDTAALTRSDTRLENLCEFLAKTVPKQSVYGVHSGYRLLFETRPAKLCRRLPYEIVPETQLDLTMSWVLAGPTATALQDAITAALSEELTTVREAIADGTEAAPALSIPVVDGTTYPAIRQVIEEFETAHGVEWTPQERQRLIRLCLRSFGPADTPQRACPYDVVESLQRALTEKQAPSLAAVERAAATLPSDRFRPDLTPTATKLYAAILRTDRPCGRTELLERADISASSYDRRLGAVKALDRVTAVSVDGHRRWTTVDTAAPLEGHDHAHQRDRRAPRVESRQQSTARPPETVVTVEQTSVTNHGWQTTSTDRPRPASSDSNVDPTAAHLEPLEQRAHAEQSVNNHHTNTLREASTMRDTSRPVPVVTTPNHHTTSRGDRQ